MNRHCLKWFMCYYVVEASVLDSVSANSVNLLVKQKFLAGHFAGQTKNNKVETDWLFGSV